jgi:hypothetical protein
MAQQIEMRLQGVVQGEAHTHIVRYCAEQFEALFGMTDEEFCFAELACQGFTRAGFGRLYYPSGYYRCV